ncbi:unnamed protein product [Ambrosiozyma monospora]|uniref:Unnamed protein product n=1 Tax=Ambrosiozyma monospora TaxID=43982 RepID=A0ACB5U6R5_AMBMO|nr:unnamed protein product [Ambrosiozyma monospora]
MSGSPTRNRLASPLANNNNNEGNSFGLFDNHVESPNVPGIPITQGLTRAKTGKLKLELFDNGNNFTLNTASANNSPNLDANSLKSPVSETSSMFDLNKGPSVKGHGKSQSLSQVQGPPQLIPAALPAPQGSIVTDIASNFGGVRSPQTPQKFLVTSPTGGSLYVGGPGGNGNGSVTNTPNLKSPQKKHHLQTIVIPKDHWMKPSSHQLCCFPGCKVALTIKHGIVNCRKCGRLFCNLHARYRIKLNDELENDPSSNGVWCRCCQLCFVGKKGWKVTEGQFVNLTDRFGSMKAKFNDVRLDQLKLRPI